MEASGEKETLHIGSRILLGSDSTWRLKETRLRIGSAGLSRNNGRMGGSGRNILVGIDQGVDVTVKEEDGIEKQRIGPSELGEGHHREIPGQRQRRRSTHQVIQPQVRTLKFVIMGLSLSGRCFGIQWTYHIPMAMFHQ